MNAPSFSRALLAVLVAWSLAGCATRPLGSQSELVGSWRWVSIDGHGVDQPFYARYYADGRAATWPTPKKWADAKGVSYGRYSVETGVLILKTAGDRAEPRTRASIQGGKLTLVGKNGHRMIYRRLPGEVEPGRLETGAPAGFLRTP